MSNNTYTIAHDRTKSFGHPRVQKPNHEYQDKIKYLALSSYIFFRVRAPPQGVSHEETGG